MVCPGRGTASPATGRSGVERDCRAHERPCSARAARSGRHGGQQAVRHSLAFSRHAYRAATGSDIRRISALMPERDRCLRNPGTAGQSGAAGIHDPVLEVAVRSAHLPSFPDHCLHQHSPLTTVSRLLTSGRAQQQALSTPSPGEPTLEPACRYLSLQFQTIQSCILCGYPIATAVQPRFAQECAYTSRNPTKSAARSHCRSRTLRLSPTLLPLATIFWDSVFFHRICILAGPMETPLCKISF